MLNKLLTKSLTPAAALLLSLGANAMGQHDQSQGYERQDQCGPEFNLTLPKVAPESINCKRTKHQVTYELVSGTTINKREKIVTECVLRQNLTDGNDLVQEWPVEKVCPGTDYDQDQNQSQLQKGHTSGPIDTQVMKKYQRTDFDGVKEGNMIITHYTEEDLTFNGGDAYMENRPCSKITPEEFLEGFSEGQASNFKIRDLKSRIDSLVEELGKGKVELEDGLRKSWK